MDLKKLVKRLLFPSVWIVIICTLITVVGLTVVFAKGYDSNLIGIFVYVFSFYSLCILCIACVNTFPEYYRKAKERVYENKYANRYFSDRVFKTHINLYGSLTINFVYVLINSISAFLYHTNWFGIIAVYYAVIAVMRFLLAGYTRKNKIGENRLGELKSSRLCAYILLMVNMVLSGVILMMIFYNRGFEYEGFLIYVMALYTFYITTIAIVDMVRCRKFKSPIMTMSMVVRLAAALFSMLFLETAMLSQFGKDTPKETKRIMIMATGAGISVIVVTIAICLIVSWTKEINKIKKDV